MFLRFTKGRYNDAMHYRKAVMLGGNLIMEYDNKIVGIAEKVKEKEKRIEYLITVAMNSGIDSEKIVRSIKNMIGRSNKFSSNPSSKRRKYYVTKFHLDEVPVNAEINFSSTIKNKGE